MKVWRFDDCDYVAAETLEQAREWYVREHFCDIEGRLTEHGAAWIADMEVEGPLDLETNHMNTEEPGEPGNERITFAEGIRRHSTSGGTFPAVLCSSDL